MHKSRYLPTSMVLFSTIALAAFVIAPATPTPADGPKDDVAPKRKGDEKESRHDDFRRGKPFKPVQSVDRLMHGQEKLFEDLKDALLEKNWEDARTTAWLLAEMANVNHYQSEAREYHAFADQMSEECVALAKILKKRDMKAAATAASKIGETCNACHDAFKKRGGHGRDEGGRGGRDRGERGG